MVPTQVLYFSCTLLVVFVMFQRIRILRILLHASKWTLHKAFHWHTKVERSLTKTVMRIHRNPIVFFTKRYRAEARVCWSSTRAHHESLFQCVLDDVEQGNFVRKEQ